MTDEQKLRAREKRLLKTYGITLAQYDEILKAQNGCCAICGRPATDFSVNLSVDHFHFKIQVERRAKDAHCPHLKWFAWTEFRGRSLSLARKTKAEAIQALKEAATPFSVRGLLCPGRHGPAGTCCNRNLGRVDNVDWLRKALNYLENPPARKVLDIK